MLSGHPFRTHYQDTLLTVTRTHYFGTFSGRLQPVGVLISTHLSEFSVRASEAPESEEGEICWELQPRKVPHKIPVH